MKVENIFCTRVLLNCHFQPIMVTWRVGHVVQARLTGRRVGKGGRNKGKANVFLGVVVRADETRLMIRYWSIAQPNRSWTMTVPRSTACGPNQTQWTSVHSDHNSALYHHVIGVESTV